MYSTHDSNGRSPPHDEGLETRCVSQPGIFLLLIFFSDLLTLFTSILVSTVPTTATDGHHHMTTNANGAQTTTDGLSFGPQVFHVDGEFTTEMAAATAEAAGARDALSLAARYFFL